MFRSKSFQLFTEDESRKRERLYEPKRIRWMKYIVIPALIIFALLLILSNVDFTGDAYVTTRPSTTTTMATPSVEPTATPAVQTTLPTTKPDLVDRTTPHGLTEAPTRGTSNKLSDQIERKPYARCIEKEYCTLVVCSGGEVTSMVYTLQEMDTRCGQGLIDLLLEKCTLPGGSLNKNLLNGYFTLNNFTINDCGLERIDNNALNHGSLWKLKTLIFIKSSITELTESVFKKLTNLEHFEMHNEQKSSALSAQNFLKPMANKLKTFILKHQQSTTSTVYNPADWLGGTKLTKLMHVDMSETHFGDTLTSATFVNLSAVKELILASCAITSIAEGTFDAILGTLNFLDLSGNGLKTLDTDFLENPALKGKRIELHGNAWNCDCDSESFVKAITSADFLFGEEPKCATPEKLRDVDIREVKLECGLETSTTPSSSTTTTVTTTTTKATDIPTQSWSTTTTTTSPTTTSITTTTDVSSTTTTTTTTTLDTTKGTTASSTSESSETDETNETSSSGTSETEENSGTTGYETSSTTSITPTTSTPSPPAPPICSNGVEPGYVRCLCGVEVEWKICDSDAGFNVVPTSSTAVRLVIKDDMDNLNVIHFTRNNLTDSPAWQHISQAASTRTGNTIRSVRTTTVVDIGGLETNQSHVFCLVPLNGRTISPFNCRSQFLDVERAWPQAWLRRSDMALFLSLGIAGVLVCVLLGVAAIYWLLRWRPSWLKGNARVRRLDSNSHRAILFPRIRRKENRSSIDQEQNILSKLATRPASATDTLMSENSFNVQSYDYMKFYKNSGKTKQRHTAEDAPPVEPAPDIPSNATSSGSSSRCTSSQSTVRVEDATPAEVAPYGHGDNEYECLEDYLKIYS